MQELQAPTLASFREDAEALVADGDDLKDQHVVLRCDTMRAAAPSFLDELVKLVLIRHGATSLALVPVRGHTAELASRIARTRGVTDRLKTYGTTEEFNEAYGVHAS